MNKKILIPLIGVLVFLIGAVVFLVFNLNEQKEANRDMQELANLEKKEMENEYEQFARQYSEMKAQINNDSIVAQLTQEQLRTQRLLEELKRVKSDDAREITRLKKELATVRMVLRSYVLQIDSLNRLNQNLMDENHRVKDQYAEATRQIEGLSNEKASLSEKVAIASQLDATSINMVVRNKRKKPAKKIKDGKTIEVSFNIAKNVTAPNGIRTIYVRIMTPGGSILGSTGGTFAYENREIEYSMTKNIEYTGEEMSVITYWNITNYLEGGTYNVSIFADGNMIGARNFTFK
ncbi:hypothetical protein [Prevotella sp. MGM1]|mgnify:CR=1 FL=1|jgi:predicted  nucleic acid-binding Zn-ribbon protein|uniref:hypothetical protein n=1 Tax=Prevotella sp. MGM1 TaxID=2033405 RepID=UPI000CE9D36A|nr:hypothetical protein [Prevotella sp. MGM1]GAY28888.1 hypothetical protein PvtlMGM1_2188 [Prevotella sp. MGM1]